MKQLNVRSSTWRLPVAMAGALALALLAPTAGAADVTIVQGGSDNRADVHQAEVSTGRITIDQSGALNQLEVWQAHGGGDVVEAVQGGAANQARLVQSGFGQGMTQNLAVVRQLGSGGGFDLLQAGTGATAALLQSPLSSGDRASVYQAAAAPLGVIQQGVAVADNRRTLDIAAEALAVRHGAPFAAAPSTQSTAILLQSGGAGLAGIVVQGGGGQTAVLSQTGAYLEAEILQSGGAHAASVSQVGAGTASSPYRASITQLGAQPQSFSVQQQAGNSPRSIRVVQR